MQKCAKFLLINCLNWKTIIEMTTGRKKSKKCIILKKPRSRNFKPLKYLINIHNFQTETNAKKVKKRHPYFSPFTAFSDTI